MKKARKVRKYEKPKITRQTKMVFPLQILEGRTNRRVCRQCSSCHGCR